MQLASTAKMRSRPCLLIDALRGWSIDSFLAASAELPRCWVQPTRCTFEWDQGQVISMAADSGAALKVCLLGEGAQALSLWRAWRFVASVACFLTGRVGKTSILLKFVKDEFNDQQVSSIDASYMEKVVPVDGVVRLPACRVSRAKPCTPPSRTRTTSSAFGTLQGRSASMR